jgi:hypothetical protein
MEPAQNASFAREILGHAQVCSLHNHRHCLFQSMLMIWTPATPGVAFNCSMVSTQGRMPSSRQRSFGVPSISTRMRDEASDERRTISPLIVGDIKGNGGMAHQFALFRMTLASADLGGPTSAVTANWPLRKTASRRLAGSSDWCSLMRPCLRPISPLA